MEKIHRHIIGPYLDLYAADLVWRVTDVGRSLEDGLSSLMNAMMAPGRSPMAGYFLPKKNGGMKRRCQIIDADGLPAEWSPPDPLARRKAREASRRERNEAPVPRVHDARSKHWNHGFTFLPAGEFIANPKLIPGSPGVYCIFVKDGEELLAQAGHFPDPALSSWHQNGHMHLYTGESYGIRERLLQHLTGDIKESTLRESLMAIQWIAGASQHLGDLKDRAASENALSRWLTDDVVIGYKVCSYARTVEKEMLKRAASPLNISGRDASPFARLLLNFRHRFRDAVVSGLEPPPAKDRPNRRH